MSESGQRPSASKDVRRRRTLVATGGFIVLALVAVFAGIASGQEPSDAVSPTDSAAHSPTPTPPAPERPSPTGSPEPAVVPTFDKTARSIDDPNSIWLVVNKMRPLNPENFEPADLVDVPIPHTWNPRLRQEASDAVISMFAAASTEAGLTLASNSAYRSYDSQVSVYNQDVAANGQAFADTSTARPGTSEHQTGLTIDIGAGSGNCSLSTCFADTAEGQWLAANASRFGFLLRYPADKTEITGYAFEPWHFRYIGLDLSTEMHNTGVTTLEEFFGLPAAPNYG
ncbi:D-alanyl-D-alanine carboxypeptidase family protein [Leifsonia sp. A12D58]|uniref:M15 family metallopeptidase n=1 Tax=Leifsonia sp. A12D58 TaxID=3397674 RepID=UPI0039DF3A1A